MEKLKKNSFTGMDKKDLVIFLMYCFGSICGYINFYMKGNIWTLLFLMALFYVGLTWDED